jgi:dihydroorotate dehydrogenase electron transfer subunit
MKVQTVRVTRHEEIQGGYRLLEMAAPGVVPEVQPGQFIHLMIPLRTDLVLRRPFSIYRAADGLLTILYKVVGEGTAAMRSIAPHDTVNIIGPLGHGFPPVENEPRKIPILVAGGYGMAALYLVARRSPVRGCVFVGGRTATDILCLKDFADLDWDIQVATEDGSMGVRGLVTAPLQTWLAEQCPADTEPVYYACGPNGMLRAVSDLAIQAGHTAWISMDRYMGCGVGACLTCVQKVREGNEWNWARVCREGPVFEARDLVWDE